MADKRGFAVNDPEHLAGHSRESNGWGFTREDLEKHGIMMVTDVRLIWSEDTPPEMRKAFSEASHVLHFIAERAVMAQLEHDNLKPTTHAEILYGIGEDGAPVVLRKSGWRAT
jgi:hypothetical protein